MHAPPLVHTTYALDESSERNKSDNTELCQHRVNTKYKTVDKKVRPVAVQVDETHAQPMFRPAFDPPIMFTPLDWAVPLWELPMPTHQRMTPERLSTINFGPSGFLHAEELDLIKKITVLFGDAFSFSRAEKGLLKSEYMKPYEIRTIEHQPWKARTIPLPKSRMDEIRAMYLQELQDNDIEPCDGPYINPHFCVAKKNGKLRKVVDLSNLSAVSVRDLNVPTPLPEFCEDLAGRVCYGSGDGHSFFDQIPLHPNSRPMTAINTYYGLVQSTRLPQGWTNSPAVAQRVSTHIFQHEIPEHAQVFVDDVLIKGPRSDYNNETHPGTNLRLWFLEYCRTYARVLRRYAHAGLTFSGEKFIAITPRVSITGIVVDRHGKHSDPTKVARLQDWPCPPPNVSSLRGFLGLANYLRPFIAHFATLDAPLRKLLTGRWRWNDAATAAMRSLSAAAAKQPILVSINYRSPEPIILAVDSSAIAAGWALYQGEATDDQPRKLVQYGSIGFTDTESRYSQPQLELCGVLKAVKNLRYHLYGVHFILEVDAASIRQMINTPDVPNAAMTRWINYLKLFDMTVRHVPARNHTLPDGLSRTDFGTTEKADEWPADKVGLDARAMDDDEQPQEPAQSDEQDDNQSAEENRCRRASGGTTSWANVMGNALHGRAVASQEREKEQSGGHRTSSTVPDEGTHRRRASVGSSSMGIAMGDDSIGRAVASQEEEPGTAGGRTFLDNNPHAADEIHRRRATEGQTSLGNVMGSVLLRGTAASQEEGSGISGGARHHGTELRNHRRRACEGEQHWVHVMGGDLFMQAAASQEEETTDTQEGNSSFSTSNEADSDLNVSSDTDDASSPTPLEEGLYTGKWVDLARYLLSGASFDSIADLPPARRSWIKQQVHKFFVRRGRLYRRMKDAAPTLVINQDSLKSRLLREAHDQHGHRGRDAMITLLAQRFWWETLRLDCSEHVASCAPCQKRQHGIQREAMRHAVVPSLFERFNMDIVDLGPGVGPRRYLVVARDAFTGWPEARLLPDKTAASVRLFLEEDVLARYGACIRTILTDNGTENASETAWLIHHLGFAHAHSTPYNPEGNSEVERGHASLVEGLLRAAYDDRSRTAAYLPYVLWADRITRRRTTNYSPFELVYGLDPVLPMDLEFATFALFDWEQITTTADLITARTRQLKRRVDDLRLAHDRLSYARQQGRQYADDHNAHRLRQPVPVGHLVLVNNPTHSARGQDRWLGPFRVVRQLTGGSYQLAELNGALLARLVAAKHVRRYFARGETKLAIRLSQQNGEREPQPPSRVRNAPASPPISAAPAPAPTQPTQALPLPRARMTRPALPHRDIPPTPRSQPTPSTSRSPDALPALPPGWVVGRGFVTRFRSPADA